MPDQFTLPDDPVALRMENDLLALEVEHLRGRVATADSDEFQQVQAELARVQRHLEVERARVEELAQARSDLRWFLERLDGSLFGPLLRRYGGFRTLVDRWLEQ